MGIFNISLKDLRIWYTAFKVIIRKNRYRDNQEILDCQNITGANRFLKVRKILEDG